MSLKSTCEELFSKNKIHVLFGKSQLLTQVSNLYFHPVNYHGNLNALSTIQCHRSFLPLFRRHWVKKNTTIPIWSIFLLTYSEPIFYISGKWKGSQKLRFVEPRLSNNSKHDRSFSLSLGACGREVGTY